MNEMEKGIKDNVGHIEIPAALRHELSWLDRITTQLGFMSCWSGAMTM